MNIDQGDKFSMYYVVKNTCEKYRHIWSKDPVFTASYNRWVADMPLIETNRDAQAVETKGVTTNKKTKRISMADKALFIINRLQSFSNVTENHELFESVKYSASDLNKKRGTDVIGICNAVLAKANAYAADIVIYGVTADMIADFQGAIGDYTDTLANPKAAKSQTKTATQNLNNLFRDADKVLTKRLDLDIELFRTTNPDFYSQYKSARMVTTTGGSTTSVIGCVTLAGSGEPLKGVVFTFIAESNGMMKGSSTETVKPIVKKSAAKGKFRAKLPENTYKVLIEKIGCKQKEVMITVANGETTTLNIVLEKN